MEWPSDGRCLVRIECGRGKANCQNRCSMGPNAKIGVVYRNLKTRRVQFRRNYSKPWVIITFVNWLSIMKQLQTTHQELWLWVETDTEDGGSVSLKHEFFSSACRSKVFDFDGHVTAETFSDQVNSDEKQSSIPWTSCNFSSILVECYVGDCRGESRNNSVSLVVWMWKNL